MQRPANRVLNPAHVAVVLSGQDRAIRVGWAADRPVDVIQLKDRV